MLQEGTGLGGCCIGSKKAKGPLDVVLKMEMQSYLELSCVVFTLGVEERQSPV